jgi:hypothetical protein
LPYCAWRRGAVGDLQDVRRLRRSEDVIHLEMNSRPSDDSDGLKDYIHEAQISVMVTGLDDWFVSQISYKIDHLLYSILSLSNN